MVKRIAGWARRLFATSTFSQRFRGCSTAATEIEYLEVEYEISRTEASAIVRAQESLPDQPVDVASLAKEWGIAVNNQGERGAIKFRDDGVFEIVARREDDADHQRAALAHKIAHYLLHRREVIAIGIMLEADPNADPVYSEKEDVADRLARDILTPIECMHEMFKEHGVNIGLMCKKFGVPKNFIVKRICSPII